MYYNDQEHEVALRKVFNRYNPALIDLARRLTGNLDEANEIVTDAFKKVYDKNMDLSEESHIGRLLRRTVRLRCYDLLRRRKTRRKKMMGFSYVQGSPVDASDYDLVQSETEMAEKLDRIKEVLHQLPEKRRNAINAILMEGRSVEEYAESEGVAISTVYNNKNKGLEQLREMLGDSSITLLLIFCYLYQDFRN